MQTQYSISEFAQEIRKQYPGDYDDLTDAKLVELWLKKYPNDKNKVALNSVASAIPEKKENNNNNSSKYIKYIIIVIILFIAFKTNPDSKDFTDKAIEIYQNQSKNNNQKDSDAFSKALSEGIARSVIAESVKRTDFYVCSFYNLKIEKSILWDVRATGEAFGIFGFIIPISYSIDKP
ncbi:MAG: hypothetical protein J0I09_10540 [Sphingobacteriia bacterium]|nr:hypothetical protein [Sphingobacteriia bacterium]